MESELMSMGIISIIPADYCYRALLRNEKYDCFPGNCLHRGYIACRPGAFGLPDLIKGKPWYYQFFLGYVAEYIYRNYRGIFPEDRSYSELLTDDSRQEFKPPRRTADGLGTWNLCILQ